MMFLITATFFFIGLIMFALSFHESPVPVRRLVNYETVGAALMLASFWTLLMYLILEGWR